MYAIRSYYGYTKARAEGLMVSCFVGLFQRGERIIAIGVAGMVNSLINFTARANEAALLGQDAVLIVTVIFLAVGTNLTALWRRITSYNVCYTKLLRLR